MGRWNARVAKELDRIRIKLEKHYKDMQDIEFTIERGKLYMLQTRNGKRTGAASVKMAVDMVKEKLIDRKTALKRIPANDLTQLLLPSFQGKSKAAADDDREGAAGVAGGRQRNARVHCRRSRQACPQEGEQVLLVRKETSPEDVDGMHSAAGNPHFHGWHDESRSGGRSRLGQSAASPVPGEISIDAAKGSNHGRGEDLRPEVGAFDRRIDR